MDVAMLVNPAARRGVRARRSPVMVAEDAAARLRARGVRVTTLSGGSAAESVSLMHAAVTAGVDAVVVAGGDGTVRLALQEVAGRGIPLGIIPVGTGNDLAAALGLPDMDVDRAVDAIAGGVTRTVDLARVTREDGSREYFGTVLASGFDSRVNDRANMMRWPRGGSRYTIAILREFVTLPVMSFEVAMTHADGTTTRVHSGLLMATVGNGRSYGGGIPICPDADLTDGLLDVTLVQPVGRARLLRLLPRVYRGTHTSAPEVDTHLVTAVHLRSPGVRAYADGDPIGRLPLTVEVAPAALTALVPG